MRNRNGRSRTNGRGFLRTLTAQGTRVAGEVQELGRVAVTKAGKAVASIGEKGRRAVKYAKKAKGQIRDYVSTNPVKSVWIALGVGAVVGFILRRRSRPV
jgi:ElaB/YqjD/DUF883 family membrane-anchored ribosome-binding protein